MASCSLSSNTLARQVRTNAPPRQRGAHARCGARASVTCGGPRPPAVATVLTRARGRALIAEAEIVKTRAQGAFDHHLLRALSEAAELAVRRRLRRGMRVHLSHNQGEEDQARAEGPRRRRVISQLVRRLFNPAIAGRAADTATLPRAWSHHGALIHPHYIRLRYRYQRTLRVERVSLKWAAAGRSRAQYERCPLTPSIPRGRGNRGIAVQYSSESLEPHDYHTCRTRRPSSMPRLPSRARARLTSPAVASCTGMLARW